MMSLVIIGIIMLLVVLFFYNNLYGTWNYTCSRSKKEYSDKLEMPLWLLVLLILGFLIPILNIGLFLFLVFIFVNGIIDNDIYLHFKEKSFMSKLINFFNKKVF